MIGSVSRGRALSAPFREKVLVRLSLQAHLLRQDRVDAHHGVILVFEQLVLAPEYGFQRPVGLWI